MGVPLVWEAAVVESRTAPFAVRWPCAFTTQGEPSGPTEIALPEGPAILVQPVPLKSETLLSRLAIHTTPLAPRPNKAAHACDRADALEYAPYR